jgi:hypothetical protein
MGGGLDGVEMLAGCAVATGGRSDYLVAGR